MPTQNFKVGEMVNKRTVNSKTWMNFDGSYTTEIYSGLIHYEDENGDLQNINTDLIDEANLDLFNLPVSKHSKSMAEFERSKAMSAKKIRSLNHDDFDFQAPLLPFSVQIPRNITKGYSVGQNEQYIRFVPLNASPSKGFVDKEKQNVIRYQDVWNDTDVILDVNETGVKETIILKAEKAPSTFTFEVTEGAINDDGTFNDLKLENAWLVDANGTKRDVEQTIRKENDKTYIDLVADVSNLVYPIEVDPTVNINYTGIQDSVLYEDRPTVNGFNQGDMYIGKYSGYRVWGVFKFDVSSIPYSEITTANLILNNGGSGITMSIHEPSIAWDINTVNWNTFNGNPGTLVTSASTYRFDIKSAVQKWVKGAGTNNGLLLKGSNDTGGESFSTIYFTEWQYDETLRPKIEITYNRVPTTPTLTAPNGGENWNSLHTIAWNGSTDADGNPITYEIQLTTNNGSTWKTIKSGVTGGSTTYDFINEVETSTAKIRIRAYDGTSYSPWDESNGVFTIQHFHAPNTPTNLNLKGGASVDRNNIIRLSWTHSDVNGDPQAKYDLQWRLQGTSTWTTVSATTPNQYYEASPSYFPNGVIEWRVRTYDQTNLISPYSDIAVFQSGEKPSAPTIISPTNNETIALANPIIKWSSSNQIGYHLKVSDTNNNLLWEEIKSSTNKAVTLGYTLANNTAYRIQLAVKNADNLFSDFVSITIDVSYTQPEKPLMSIVKYSKLGALQINVTNIVPSGTVPEIVRNEVFRRVKGSGDEWKRIGIFTTDEEVTFSGQLKANFEGKVSGSTVENPHKASWSTSTQLVTPSSSTTEFINSSNNAWNDYKRIFSLDGSILTNTATVSSSMAQHLLSFNIIEAVERNIGKIPGTTVAEKVQWIKDNVASLICDWYGFGSSVGGNKASFKWWKNTTNKWEGDPIYTVHTQNKVSKIGNALNFSWAKEQCIDSNGFVHFLAYANASDGTTPSVINTDYVELLIDYAYKVKKGLYMDSAVASGIEYEYFVRGIGENGTFADSDILSDSVEFKDVRLHLVSNPNESITLRFNGSRSFKTSFTVVQSEFAGRKKPVTEFGEMINNNLSLSYLVKQEDINKFEELLFKRDTMLYRDSRGRKLYVIADGYSIKDVMRFDHYEVDLPLYETDYTEEV